MRAVIVEIKGKFAAVLSDDGCIKKIRNKNYETGQVIEITNPQNSFYKKLAAASFAAVLLLFAGAGTWAYASPYLYVSLDVNPSIEYLINRFDRVINVKAVNDDGAEIINKIDINNIKNHKIEKAITDTLEQISDEGYFKDPGKRGIVIAASSKNEDKANDLADDLRQIITEELSDTGNDADLEVYSVGMERVEEARKLGITPGKLNLIKKLQKTADPDLFNIDEWLDKPVKEIMQATKRYKETASTPSTVIPTDGKSSNTEGNNKGNGKTINDKNGKTANEENINTASDEGTQKVSLNKNPEIKVYKNKSEDKNTSKALDGRINSNTKGTDTTAQNKIKSTRDKTNNNNSSGTAAQNNTNSITDKTENNSKNSNDEAKSNVNHTKDVTDNDAKNSASANDVTNNNSSNTNAEAKNSENNSEDKPINNSVNSDDKVNNTAEISNNENKDSTINSTDRNQNANNEEHDNSKNAENDSGKGNSGSVK